MTNLTAISSLTKKILWVLALALLIGFLLFLIIYKFSPHETKDEKPLNLIESPQFNTISATVGRFKTEQLTAPENIPKKIPVYKLSSEDSFLIIANTFATKLGFADPPRELNDARLGQGLLFAKDNRVLSIYKDLITYQKSVPQSKVSPFDETFLRTKAIEFISALEIPTVNLAEEPITYIKLTNEGLLQTKNASQANFIKFLFRYSLADLKVVGDSNGLQVTLHPAGDVVGFTFRLLKTEAQLGDYPILDLKDALRLLQANKGFLIGLSGEWADIEASKDLGEVALTKAYLTYYLPIKTPNIIQPAWIFEGKSVGDTLEVDADFAVPAIESKYFSPSLP